MFLVGLLLTATLSVTAGCSSESEYCDETGCFFCDGLGCREIEPPERLACRGDFECTVPGEVCTDLGCAATGCSEDADCAMGHACRDSYCVAPTEPNPTPTPGACMTNGDCDDDLQCLDGMCVPTEAPPACTVDDDCEGAMVCAEGECREPSNVCRFSSECGEGRVCINERCALSCQADPSICPEGFSCGDDGVCVEETASPECVSNSDCDGEQVCLDGSCVDECSTDAECAEHEYCYFGSCRFDDRPNHFCESDTDCNEGAVCRNYVCRSPCTENAECPRFDVSLTFCLDNVCATTNEATSDCSEAADCMAGQNCIDGICRD